MYASYQEVGESVYLIELKTGSWEVEMRGHDI
jgi:hypothetical protein